MHSFIRSIRVIGVCALVGLGMASQTHADTTGFSPLGEPGGSVNLTAPTDGDDSLFLTDQQHIGTVGQGTLTSAFASPVDAGLNADIASATQLHTIESTPSAPVAVPLPRTWQMGLVGLLIVACLGPKWSRRVLH